MLHLSPDPRPPCVTYGYGLSLVGGANATFAAKAAVVTASGASSGATRGGLSAALYGGSASDIFKASLRGAVVGGATAALTFGVAHGAGGESIFGTSIWADGATMAAEAAIGGAGSVAEGGDFLSGAIGSLGGALGELSGGNFMVRTAIAAAAGGTAAEIGGGSFENGAISAAYTYMFNHAAEQGADIEIIKSAKTETGYGLIDGIQDGLSVLGLVPFAGDVVDGINALIYLARGQHAEAAMSAAAMVPFGGIVSTGLRLSKRVGKLFKLGKSAPIQFGKVPNQVSHTFRHIEAAGLQRGAVQSGSWLPKRSPLQTSWQTRPRPPSVPPADRSSTLPEYCV